MYINLHIEKKTKRKKRRMSQIKVHYSFFSLGKVSLRQILMDFDLWGQFTLFSWSFFALCNLYFKAKLVDV